MKEQAYVNYLLLWLQKARSQGKCLFIRNNTGMAFRDHALKSGVVKRYAIHFGSAGSPDVLVFTPSHTWHVELKSTTGVHRDGQLKWRGWIEAAKQLHDDDMLYSPSHTYITIRSDNDVLQFLLKAGLITSDEYEMNRRMV